jgi:hypothetical protein
MEREIALRCCLTMTVHTVVSKKRLSKAGKVFVDFLPGGVSLGTCYAEQAPREYDG